MPGGMTGPQLADEMAKRRPGTKVLYTSGYTEGVVVQRGSIDRGMLLSKPYRKSVLAGMIRQALGDAPAKIHETESIRPADTSIVVPMRRQAASVQALSSR
jgi:hypothetical protein